MVDAALGVPERKAQPAFTGGTINLRVITDLDEARERLAALPGDTVHTGSQHPAFLASWLTLAGCKPLFLELRAPGSGPVLLPLELCDNGIAAYCGEKHANGNFPVGRARDITALAALGSQACISALRHSRVPASAIILERQHQTWKGIDNPFVSNASLTSPNPALSLELTGGFDAVLATRSGKRKRKKWRNQNSKMEAIGPVTYLHPAPAEQVPALLDRFFELKAIRFREQGIGDVFAVAGVRNFVHALFKTGMAQHPHSHEVHALMIGDVPAAIIGCTIHEGHLTVEFGTFDEQFYNAGPGETLFFSAIRDACERGISVFDFGVGDEWYKRGWCDIETRHFDTAIGLTPKGRLQSLLHTARTRAETRIKSDPQLWAFVKKVRRLRGGARPEPSPDADRDD